MISSSTIACTTLPGNVTPRSSTIVAPTRIAMIRWYSPYVCESGRTHRMRSSPCRPRYSMIESETKPMLRCRNATPFGTPVEPDV